jgi:hypothetical protein
MFQSATVLEVFVPERMKIKKEKQTSHFLRQYRKIRPGQPA